jgi:hypothetical protein
MYSLRVKRAALGGGNSQATASAPQEPLLKLPKLRGRRRSELIEEASPPLLVDPEGFGKIAARGQDLHQERVSVLAKWSSSHEFATDPLSRGELGASDAQGDLGVCLHRRETDLL